MKRFLLSILLIITVLNGCSTKKLTCSKGDNIITWKYNKEVVISVIQNSLAFDEDLWNGYIKDENITVEEFIIETRQLWEEKDYTCR
ncbi:hypothetical protein RJG79_08505 [Mycoplasmatota bacterium WC44]